MAIMWNKIKRWEGTQKVSSLYVPNNRGRVIGKSGVTLPSGLDLGQMSMSELLAYDLPMAANMMLSKYIGIKGQEALELLKVNQSNIEFYKGLAIDSYITQRVHEVYTRKAKRHYEKNSLFPWDDLTDEQQTVFASVYFQHGSLRKAAPNFLRQFVNQDWEAVKNNLRNFTSLKNSKGVMRHSWRRNEEADLLVS